jgi:hypothetical protein
MYAAIKGFFENGHVVLTQNPPTNKKTAVIVMFITEDNPVNPVIVVEKGIRIGSLVGKGYSIPDDFNAPLDELKEYM